MNSYTPGHVEAARLSQEESASDSKIPLATASGLVMVVGGLLAYNSFKEGAPLSGAAFSFAVVFGGAALISTLSA